MPALIRNATIITMNDAMDVVTGDVWIADGRIAGVGRAPEGWRADTTIDAAGGLVLPGFVQTHVHLCQTLFRGLADDLPLLAWLKTRVWPLEAAHDEQTLRAAAQLAAAELLLGGTTTVLTMETVHGTGAVFEALVPTGLRAIVGKCLMNVRGDAPARLWQSTRDALDETLALDRQWSGSAGGRLRAALAPRFAISCSRDLLEATAALSHERSLLVHTHASEQREEIDVVRAQTGLDNVAYLSSVGLATERLCAAHCVWVTDAEQRLLAERHVKVLHCPGSNLKLGSGVAPVTEMRRLGISVSLGADGAACNNTLDMFHEMRLAATLQAMRHGPGALPAREVVRMATREGAHALGLDREIGSVEPGKRADLIVVATGDVQHVPGTDPYSTLVYACSPADVRVTMVDGVVVAQHGQLAWADRGDVAAAATSASRSLLARAGLR
ncbi:MAG TPA: 5'-deoxyadenosine deaminase [Vicinamibacterales bacterium]|nr:5'-deoxyadenosine deaminase [Vicinamibacterales bacterium]